MVSDAYEALQRLKERVSRAASVWLDEARVQRRAGGRFILRVKGPFQKRWLEDRHGAVMQEVFGGPVEVVADEKPAPARPPRAMPRLHGPAGEFAARMVRAFVEGGPALSPLIVLHGPPRSGKSVLVDWACALGGPGVFRLDLARLRSGRSRGLIPRKPLVVADGVECLAQRPAAQRTLFTMVDAIVDRGHRFLCTLEGHPGERPGLIPALRSRLLGGVLVPVEAQVAAVRRRPDAAAPVDPLGSMKDRAARLFGVERHLLDGGSKRRSVVEARRTVIAAACRIGLDRARVGAAFGLRSERALRDACHWAARQEQRDRRYAALLHEVGRVPPNP